MWGDAYAKILDQGDLGHAALLLIVGLLTAGMVTVWRAWRKDVEQFFTYSEKYSEAVAKMREILLVIKDRVPR
jgi:predicted negative regulator of RcsB-dependent stress response